MRKIFLCLVAAIVVVPLAAGADPGDPFWSDQWGMEKVGAEAAWGTARGGGITIAVIDTGVDIGHEDLLGKVVSGHDYVEGDDDPRDENGHGTHVSGIAAANTFNRRGVAGVAPEARILAIRVLDQLGFNIAPNIDEGQILASTAQAVIEAVDKGAHVINLSLGSVGGGGPSPALADAIDYAWANGRIVVVAAGNDDGAESGYTAEPALVVVATTRNDTKPSYSNTVGDAKWGISAPGGSSSGEILSTYCCDPFDPGPYANSSGTSMAAPHVSGAVALLRSMGVSPQKTVDVLLQTATDVGPAGRDSTFGFGRLNLAAAVASVKSVGGPSSGSGTPSRGRGRNERTEPGQTPAERAAAAESPGPTDQQPSIAPSNAPTPPLASEPRRKVSLLLIAAIGLAAAAAGGLVLRERVSGSLRR